jgi:hypothetical protein
MNFSFGALVRGVDVPRTAAINQKYQLKGHPSVGSEEDYPSLWAHGPALRRRLKLHVSYSQRSYNRSPAGLRDHPQLLERQVALELRMRLGELRCWHRLPDPLRVQTRQQGITVETNSAVDWKRRLWRHRQR